MTNPLSYQRLMQLGISELPDDINGVPDGEKYRPFLTFEDLYARTNLVASLDGIYSGRSHVCASLEEAGRFCELEGNPFIASIREAYVISNPKVVQDLRDGKKVARNRVMTIDFVVTLSRIRSNAPLRYMGLSSKPEPLKHRADQERRASKEELALRRLGWGWSYLKPQVGFSVRNHGKLRTWAKRGSLDGVVEPAKEMAKLLYRSASTKDLDGRLRACGTRLGLEPSIRYFVFASAYYLGYIQLNHMVRLGEECPLVLTAPAWPLR